MTVSANFDVLSERELEVLKLVATGATNQQIARELVISPNTVKVHLRNIFEKLGVQSRTEATMEAVRRGWVHVPGEAAGAPAAAVAAVAAPAVAATAVAATPPAPEVEGQPAVEAEPAPVAEPPVPIAPAAPELPPISLPELMPHAPAHKPVAAWQRVLLVVALVLAVIAALAPSWLTARSAAASLTAFTDVGRPQVAPPARISVQRWSPSAPLPEPRSRLALVSDGNRIYAIGGETADGVTGELAIYDPKTNGWLPGAAKPTPTSNIAAGLVNGRIYVPGGSTANGGVSDVLEIYDPATGKWSTGPKLPGPLAAYALAVWDDKLYLLGGWDGAGYRRETLIFDPAAGTWLQGPPLPSARAFAGAAVLNDIIYLVGGTNGRSDLAELLALDPRTNASIGSPWKVKASTKQPRSGLGVAAVGTQVFALGGSGGSSETFNEQYDPRLDAWSRLGTPIAGAWRNLAVAPLGGKLYAVGGWSGAYLDAHEQYTALLRLMIPSLTR